MILWEKYQRYISSKAAALGESIEESKLVKKLLGSLPNKKFLHMVASLEKLLDLKTTSFEEVIGRLKTYEERISIEEEEHQENQTKLIYANMESSQNPSQRDYNGDYRVMTSSLNPFKKHSP